MLFRPAPRKALIVVQLVLLAVLVILGLAGCAAPAPPAAVVETRYQVVRVTLPPGLLKCADAPPVPQAPTLQSEVAGYMVRLWEAGQDCRDDVASIATIENAPPSSP
jgi:hypothetical protein